MADGRLPQAESVGEFGDTASPVGGLDEEGEKLNARGVGERPEPLCDTVRFLSRHPQNHRRQSM